jgi:hypothetical protein
MNLHLYVFIICECLYIILIRNFYQIDGEQQCRTEAKLVCVILENNIINNI